MNLILPSGVSTPLQRSLQQFRKWTKLQCIVLILILHSLSKIAFAASNGELPDGLRKWNATDSVSLRYFIELSSNTPDLEYRKRSSEVMPSPDGRRFFFIEHSGDPSSDKRTFKLSVYESEDILKGLATDSQTRPETRCAPLVRETSERGMNWMPISGAVWEHDSQGVIFRARDPNGIHQIWRLNTDSGMVTQLTSGPIAGGFPDTRGKGLLYINQRSIAVEPPRYPIHLATARGLGGHSDGRLREERPTVMASYDSRPAWPIHGKDLGGQRSLSPDGRWAVLSLGPLQVPKDWEKYDGVLSDPLSGTSNDAVSKDREYLCEFTLIDLKEQRQFPMLHAPTGDAIKAFSAQNSDENRKAQKMGAGPLECRAYWAYDSQHLILFNTALPLDAEKPERVRMAYIVAYDVTSKKWNVLEPMKDLSGNQVVDAGWIDEGRELLVRHRSGENAVAGTVYRLEGKDWKGRSVGSEVRSQRIAASLAGGLNVEVREGANIPPMVVASAGGREIALTTADPVLKGVWWAKTERFDWVDARGKIRAGGLLMPRDASLSSKRIPLVVQLGAYQPDRFRPDGPSLTAYAAQPLVARGIAVLNLTTVPGDSDGPLFDLTGEYHNVSDDIERAVTSLAKLKPIDLDRIGLLGFSHTGTQAYYTISHPRRIRFAAAVLASCYQDTFNEYINFSATKVNTSDIRRYTSAGKEFFEAKADWFNECISFNIDRIVTPTIYISAGRGVDPERDIIGSFLAAKRPIECVEIENGAHQLEAPLQRQVCIQSVVDWMAFWLRDELPVEPEWASRWMAMKRRWDEIRSVPPPPKGKWVFQPDPVQPEWHPPAESKPAAESKKEESKVEVPASKP